MSELTRREWLELVAGAGAAATLGCGHRVSRVAGGGAEAIGAVVPLGSSWQTRDPFLFCVHHDDRYPAGNERMGPAASLEGREPRRDFAGKDGWRMYHGEAVPGFPQHPHRGFETVTVVRRGLLDHSDSLGSVARYGNGDVQWLTAGRGILHAEMFPLLDRAAPNPLELFQIWLNLPSASKMVDPYFSMLWDRTIPRHVTAEPGAGTTEVTVVAGRIADREPPPPPPSSWGARRENDVAIWAIRMAGGSRWTLPAAAPGTNRTLYFFRGAELRLGGRPIPASHLVELRPDVAVTVESGAEEAEALLLQGRPIGEPVARHGPFVMNTTEEIRAAYADYERTRFGGWPWPSDEPVHAREEGRFARGPSGREAPG